MSLINLLSTGPGTFVYHLMLLLVLEAMVSIVLTDWRYARNPNHRRILWAFGGLLVMRALLLFGEPLGPAAIAPLLSGIELASLTLLGWAFLAPLLNHRTGRIYLLSGLGVALLCAVTFLPGWHSTLAQFPHRLYLTFWQQTFWYAVSVLLALGLALVLLFSKQQRRQLPPIFGFATLFLGFTTLCVGSLSLTVGWFDVSAYTLIGVGRLINMLGYPLFAVTTHHIALQGRWAYREGLQDVREETLHRTREPLFLAQASQTIAESLDLDTILQQGVENAAKALDADRCAIFLINPNQPGTVNLPAQYPPVQRAGRPAVQPTFPLAEQLTLAYALKRRKQLTINAETNNPHLRALYTLLGSQEAGPTIVQPLLRQRRILGALVVGNDRSQRAFEPDEGRLCQNIAVQVAVAIENTRLYRDLQAQIRQQAESLQSQEDEIHRKAAVLESITEGVIVSDKEGRIVIANTAAANILDVPRQRVLGRSIESLMNHVPLVPQADWSTIVQSDTPLETVFELKSRVVHVNAAPVVTPTGDHLGVVAILRDITGETEAERSKSEFITATFYELRTSLTAILGYAEALASDIVGAVSDAQSRLLKIIRDNALRMVSLTENLIAASQIEKGFLKLEYGETDLHLLINDVVRSFQSQLEARQLEVSLELNEDLSKIETDPARVRQILDNLVSNAIKFNYPGGHITIGAKPLRDSEEQPPKHCSIWVSDTGIGIPPEEQPHIWERFYRPASPLAAEASGLGVGLSIVKSLVEAHSGRVWVNSTPGVGSTFTVILPIKRVQTISYE
jgi:PAS domain S-box-containing protein